MGLNRKCVRVAFCAAMFGVMAACGGGKKLDFPQEVPGGWKLRTKTQLAATNASQSILNQGLESWWQAEYSGPSDPTVFLYEMKSSASAFELVQTNRAMPGMIVFNKDRFFIVMQTMRGTIPDLNRFAGEFEKVF